MEKQTNGLQEVLQSIEETKQRLEALGITPEHFEEAQGLLVSLREAEDRIDSEREKQFWPDAFVLAKTLKVNQKVSEIAVYLREFADHIAAHTLRLSGGSMEDLPGAVQSLVDQIPPITEQDEGY